MTVPIGIVFPPNLPASAFVRFVQRAQELGFDELWLVEDCFLKGGIAQAAVALAATSRIRIGVGILPAAARNVAFASMEVATLANLFPERLIVGVGHGMPSWMRQTGIWPASPLTLLDEYVTALKALLAGETVHAEGRYVRLRDVRLAEPPSVVPPIYTGVRGPKSIALSGRVADGTILAEPVTPEYLAATREQIGPDAPGHKIATYNVAAIDESADRARTIARSGLRWVGEPEWSPHIAPLPFAAEFAALRAVCSSREEFAARMPDAWVDQLAVCGTPADAKRRLGELAAAGADHLILVPAGADALASLGSLALVLAP